MYFYRTIDNDELLRIEDEDGSAITLSLYDHVARILSVYVHEDDRREGVGTGLLRAAEKEALERGCTSMEADVSEELQDVCSFLEDSGFTGKSEAPVYILSMKTFLTSHMIKGYLAETEKSSVFIPFSGLDVGKWEEIFSYGASVRMPIGSNYISRFSPLFSGVFYDKSGVLKAIIMATEGGGKLFCDMILSENCEYKYLPSAINDYFMYLQDVESENTYSRIELLAADPDLMVLMKELFGEKNTKDPVSFTKLFRKKLEKADPDVEIYDDESEWDGSHGFWLNELKNTPLQKSIVWHLPWNRSGASGLGAPQKRKKKIVDVVTPYINDEDERKGLHYEDTLRITAANLADFEKDLSAEELEMLKRPFFRGLIIPKEAVLFYELRNVAEEEDVVSELKSFRFKNKEAGKRLLEEYFEEAAKWEAITTRFEFPELSYEQREVLEESGFVLEKRESKDIVVTVEQILEDDKLLGIKADPAIKPLKVIDERQFKRGVKNCLTFRSSNTLQDFGYLPKEWYENDISCCILEGNRVCGFLLFYKASARRLAPVYMLSMRKEASKDIIGMLTFALQAVGEQYPTNTEVVIRNETREVEKLLKKVCPNAEGDLVVFGER